MVTKLYRVRSMRDDLRIVWIAVDRKKPPGEPSVRYADVIEGLSADAEATAQERDAVDEFFTREEAEAWREHLQAHYGDVEIEIELVEQPLPLEKNVKSLVSRRGSQDLIPSGGINHPSGRFKVYSVLEAS